MSSSYLDKFRSSLPNTQGNQILKLLIAQRDSGELRTVDEFKDRLKELTATLIAERITPTLKLFPAVPGDDTSSEQYNEMLNRIRDDLEAAFTEADNLDEIIAAHHNLIQHVALKALRFGVNELDSKITLYEFLNRSRAGFDDALFNTFRESTKTSTSRSDAAASIVYADPRRGAVVTSTEDAMVDLVGERLIMGPDVSRFLNVREVRWLANTNSVRSELDVSFKTSRLSNMLDGTQNTFWVVPLLLEEIRPAGAPLELALSLNAHQDINFVELEPASEFPMVLTGIDYLDANNDRQVATTEEVVLHRPTRINFKRVTAQTLICKFKQENYKEVQFKEKVGTNTFERAVLGENSPTVDLDGISNELQEVLTSEFILSDVLGLTRRITETLKYYEYILGFDNIKLGFATFEERSIFVSAKKTVDKPLQVGLRTQEVRPVQYAGTTETVLEPYTYPARDDTEDGKFYHSSIEYWLWARFYTPDGFLISTEAIPVLPLGAQRVYHERMVFTDYSTGAETADISPLVFHAGGLATNALVYRNGTLLTYGAGEDWTYVNIETAPGAGVRMQRAIQIEGDVEPLDIYTVSYTPRVGNCRVLPPDGLLPAEDSTTVFRVTDMVGDNSVRIVTDNLLVFEGNKGSYEIDHADFYLSVITRRNSANQNFSPAVEEYMLVTGSHDSEKFTGG